MVWISLIPINSRNVVFKLLSFAAAEHLDSGEIWICISNHWTYFFWVCVLSPCGDMRGVFHATVPPVTVSSTDCSIPVGMLWINGKIKEIFIQSDYYHRSVSHFVIFYWHSSWRVSTLWAAIPEWSDRGRAGVWRVVCAWDRAQWSAVLAPSKSPETYHCLLQSTLNALLLWSMSLSCQISVITLKHCLSRCDLL